MLTERSPPAQDTGHYLSVIPLLFDHAAYWVLMSSWNKVVKCLQMMDHLTGETIFTHVFIWFLAVWHASRPVLVDYHIMTREVAAKHLSGRYQVVE